MKYLYLVVAIILMGCSQKSPEVIKVAETKTKVEVVEVASVDEVVNVGSKSETLIVEPKVTKNIGADIATSCEMWSDGCNVCTRLGNGKASCTTNPECQNKMFSCLQWQ
ncbi:MAG: Unknown protein [uncultured Sulfurovum sp.]|uniref:Uncharacterized protein n=1 Tax=uncultured Sulfurovum sp. TaxID=269237 RepID=A0A6S6TLU0_9BACT|nr:MAG: Unknown protein [uncultured Sulfurovum sp.]